MPPTRSIRLAKTAGVINTDVMGVLGPARDFSIRGNQKFGLLDMLVEEGAKRGRTLHARSQARGRRLLPLRPFPFAKAGVPAMSFTPGNDLVNGGVARGAGAGRPITPPRRYHQPDDEYSTRAGTSPAWSRMRELLHAVGLRLANSSDWPNWSADSEFRAERDETANAARRRPRSCRPAPPASRAATETAAKGERGK